MRLRIPFACQRGCALCAGAVLDAPVLSADVVQATLAHAQETGQGRVYCQGRDVANSPHLASVLSAAPRSLDVALVEDGPGLDLPVRVRSLRQMGIACVYVSLLDPTAEFSTAAVRSLDQRKQSLAVLLALSRGRDLPVGVHVPLTEQGVRELSVVLRLLARLSIRELLLSEVLGGDGAAESLDPAVAVAALERAWRGANAARVRLRLIGFERLQYVNSPVGEPAPSCDSALIEIVRRRIPLAAVRAGIHALGVADHPSSLNQLVKSAAELRDLGLELAARRSPLLDLPACLGGTQVVRPAAPVEGPTAFSKSDACHACPLNEPCPGASKQIELVPPSSLLPELRPLSTWYGSHRPQRILILSSMGGDGLFYISTLPALAEALRRHGVSVEIVSPWLSRWKPRELPALGHDRHARDWMSTVDVEAWLKQHDLAAFDLVITSDFPTARVALAAGSLGAAARIVVTDFHMLETMHLAVAAWVPPGGRAAEGGWWPAEQLVVESAFPAHVQLYLNYGVPLDHISWRPFALCAAHFPPGPDVHESNVMFSGGDHLRDVQTLRAATELLSDTVHPIDLYAFGERLEGNAHLRHQGSVSVPSFYRALASSRFVVLPLQDESNCAAGVTVATMALMAGRPLVVTGTAAIRDYVQHGVEALLVPPGDPDALADAIARLDTDPALLSTLAEGARQAGARISTQHWAEQIMSGAPLLTPRRTPFGWRHW